MPGSGLQAGMEPGDFDEGAFFKAVERSGARALLIGRRALVVLGLPLLTADYDFWLHIDDIEPRDREDIRLLEALRDGGGR